MMALQIVLNNGDSKSIFGAHGMENIGENGVLGMDSHADVSCAGMDALIVSKSKVGHVM